MSSHSASCFGCLLIPLGDGVFESRESVFFDQSVHWSSNLRNKEKQRFQFFSQDENSSDFASNPLKISRALFVCVRCQFWPTSVFLLLHWLVVWNMNFMTFHILYWECHHPNWLIFFRGVGQPPTSSILHFSGLYPRDCCLHVVTLFSLFRSDVGCLNFPFSLINLPISSLMSGNSYIVGWWLCHFFGWKSVKILFVRWKLCPLNVQNRWDFTAVERWCSERQLRTASSGSGGKLRGVLDTRWGSSARTVASTAG